MKLQPKKLLVSSKKLTDFLKEVFDDENFHRGAEVALVQMQLDMTYSDDPVVSAANSHRMEGARMFLGKLMNIVDLEAPPEKKPPIGRLNPNA